MHQDDTVNAYSFAELRQPQWQDLDHLVRKRPAALGANGVSRLGSLYRDAAADLAYVRREFPDAEYLDDLDARVRRARQRIYRYEQRAPLGRRIVRTLTVSYWRAVRYRPVFLLVGAVMFFGPFVLSAFWAQSEPDKARGLAPDGVESVVYRERADFQLPADRKAEMSAEIYTNNIRIALMAVAGGATAGLVTILATLYNGVALGATFGLTIQAGNGDVLWEFVLPHGVLELSCLVVASAAGLRWGWSMISPGERSRRAAFTEEARRAVTVAIGTAIVLFFCGIVEGVVSTSGLDVTTGLAVGFSLGGLYWLGIAVLGHGADPIDDRIPVTTVT